MGGSDPDSLLSFLIHHGPLWVRSQRERCRSSARSLSQEERSALSGFFDPEILALKQGMMQELLTGRIRMV
jgi:hypothetical protein